LVDEVGQWLVPLSVAVLGTLQILVCAEDALHSMLASATMFCTFVMVMPIHGAFVPVEEFGGGGDVGAPKAAVR
jgi:hypothetical protein